MEYSVIIPVFNESESFTELIGRLAKVFKSVGKENSFEIIFVDDGSTDSSKEILRNLCLQQACVRAIFLRKNSGKSFALNAGFIHAKGNFIITIDGDLQDRPEEIPRLIKKINEGYDLVSGWKKGRQDGIIRVLGSWIFNRVVSSFGGFRLHDFNCGFKIYKAEVFKSIFVYGQYYRFIPLLAHFLGFKVAELRILHDKRKYGVSKYSTFRYQGFFDFLSILFIYKYRFSPLYFFGTLGLFFIIPSSLVVFYLVGWHIVYLLGLGKGHILANRPLLAFSLTICLLGMQIFLTGLVCEYILHHQGNKRVAVYIDNLIEEIL